MKSVIIGATGGIGFAFLQYSLRNHDSSVAIVRSSNKLIQLLNDAGEDPDSLEIYEWDGQDEQPLISIAQNLAQGLPLNWIINATGALHNDQFMPEKQLGQLSANQLHWMVDSNVVPGMLVCKHLIPLLAKKGPSVMAHVTGRVGSIDDNQLGGWYSYRASKAMLNMLLKSATVEARRRFKNSCILSLHPGTVASDLSAPFQKNVPAHKLFTAEQSVGYMIDNVLAIATPEMSGQFRAYDGELITW